MRIQTTDRAYSLAKRAYELAQEAAGYAETRRVFALKGMKKGETASFRLRSGGTVRAEILSLSGDAVLSAGFGGAEKERFSGRIAVCVSPRAASAPRSFEITCEEDAGELRIEFSAAGGLGCDMA